MLDVAVVATRPVVRNSRVCRAKPRVVVERRGNWLGTAISAGAVAANADFDTRNPAKASIADEVHDLAELRTRPLPRADLNDKTLRLRDIGDDAAFLNRLRKRLLQEDVLPGEKAVCRDDGVLVVGDAEEDGVNRLVRKHLAVVAVDLDFLDDALLRVAFLNHLLAIGRALAVILAEGGYDAAIGELLDAWDVHSMRNAAIADNCDVDLPVGEKPADTAVEKHRRGATCNHTRNKLPSIHVKVSLCNG